MCNIFIDSMLCPFKKGCCNIVLVFAVFMLVFAVQDVSWVVCVGLNGVGFCNETRRVKVALALRQRMVATSLPVHW